MDNKAILQIKDLTISFRTTHGMVRAVRGVDFDLTKGETLAIVGESGSGKSVTSRTIMGILAGNGVIDKGQIIYEGQDLTQVDEEHFHELRGNKIGMIFQDPLSSLNPIMRIGKQITEGMILNGKRLKNRYRDLIHQEKNDYSEIKHKIETTHRIYKKEIQLIKDDKSEKTVAEVKSVYKETTLDLKQKLVPVKVKLNKAKKAAKIQVRKETLARNEKYRQDLADLKVKAENDHTLENKINKANAKILDIKNVFATLKEKSEKDLESYESKADERGLLLDYKKAKAQLKKDLKAAKAELYALENFYALLKADLKEEYRRYKKVTKKEAKEKALVIMKEVGIPEPEKRFVQYPFQFSGGMRQRIVIAIALTANPDILICDEPTTALDVTIQAQILELINKIKAERNLSVIFITHDLGVVANMADRIAVMYAGKIVEVGTSEEVFYNPKHPYTWALLSSMPDINSNQRLIAIPGTPPNMLFPPKGDAFAVRNKYAMKIDFEKEPPMFKITDTHYAATWLLHPDAPKTEMPDLVKNRIKKMLEHDSKGVNNNG